MPIFSTGFLRRARLTSAQSVPPTNFPTTLKVPHKGMGPLVRTFALRLHSSPRMTSSPPTFSRFHDHRASLDYRSSPHVILLPQVYFLILSPLMYPVPPFSSVPSSPTIFRKASSLVCKASNFPLRGFSDYFFRKRTVLDPFPEFNPLCPSSPTPPSFLTSGMRFPLRSPSSRVPISRMRIQQIDLSFPFFFHLLSPMALRRISCLSRFFSFRTLAAIIQDFCLPCFVFLFFLATLYALSHST